ncbi:aminomethyl-transferring glycine dehydrogenase [Porphyromonas levii]|uniref:glycine dehydrogenase (aminomethyl-transferring) n=1 Tax=Porphyromonas levii TaxID=28114 RepID=A0A4Y8WR94_9PORP|nr:aminomethyl-transferring glycine dehydrogenase [Porphyromonas levii]MBR8766377.1 Glycine dehydrogenase (decarboxylating) [Porphyromonas levii]TFH96059.1 aminomethyl-transferring glycine dehydrogenase [Porphyromonas levii]TFH96431.1 aminomethyl-transferring glycine dehydrogenase [Porphyromonas levii]
MNTNDFTIRHVGVTSHEDEQKMLKSIGVGSVKELIDKVIPSDIRLKEELDLPEAMTERELIEHINELGNKNKVFTSYIGMGWYDNYTPAVIQRNVLENPGFYTSYTPYQAEISQGRLEALFNFQTVITELTGLMLTNCSLLDEGTSGAEAAAMMLNIRSRKRKDANKLFVATDVFQSTRSVIQTRAAQWHIEVVEGKAEDFDFSDEYFGAIIQYTNDHGEIKDYKEFVAKAKEKDIRVAVAADLLSLVLLTPPGEWGADIVFGSAQRFGIPMYFGGPSAGFLASTDEYKRVIPGRIVGISKDPNGKEVFRLALQTREQHIKREKATSNICTAQALLATMSSFYAVFHGPEGLKDIAGRVHTVARVLNNGLTKLGYTQSNKYFFDTLYLTGISKEEQAKIKEIALDCKVNFRYFEDGAIGISVDETTLLSDLSVLFYIFATAKGVEVPTPELPEKHAEVDNQFRRTSNFLEYEVFQKYHTETELMRYAKRLEKKDISLAQSMISLGSCTMKLNAAAELFILSNPQFAFIHPYAPADQTEGYIEMLDNTASLLGTITGLPGVSFMPNSGAAGEYSGIRVISEYLKAKGESQRDLIILPASAHGTNPATASLAGFEIIIANTDADGNIDVEDFVKKATEHKERLAATMITYPSTHGIFEAEIRKLIDTVHEMGGLVYMDGANMNAQVGFTNPGEMGADVCHLNLHKTFAIPHGGGGPGEGPICVAEFLKDYLPSHAVAYGHNFIPVGSAPFGSAVIVGITYAYIRMLGTEGLKRATAGAILNANYMASRLKDTYGITYSGKTGYVGHELILECRNVKEMSGIDETDIAKRLMDFNYHAPTLSFPVHGTLMIEPTESESLAELDRFIEVLNTIWNEIQEVVNGTADKEDNVLKNAPHPLYEVASDEWKHPYSREKAAFALPYLKEDKYWTNVGRADNGFGDRNLVATYSCCQF